MDESNSDRSARPILKQAIKLTNFDIMRQKMWLPFFINSFIFLYCLKWPKCFPTVRGPNCVRFVKHFQSNPSSWAWPWMLCYWWMGPRFVYSGCPSWNLSLLIGTMSKGNYMLCTIGSTVIETVHAHPYNELQVLLEHVVQETAGTSAFSLFVALIHRSAYYETTALHHLTQCLASN